MPAMLQSTCDRLEAAQKGPTRCSMSRSLTWLFMAPAALR